MNDCSHCPALATRMLAIVMVSVTFIATNSAQTTSDLAPSSQPTVKISAPKAVAANAPVPDGGTAPDLLIDSGDLLQVSVFGVNDFNQEVRVSATGDISLPPLDPLHVEGLTPHQAEVYIQKRLAEGGIFKDPRVSVFVKEYATQGVYVMGEVAKPGVYPLQGSHSLFDFISAAGGLTPKAGNSVTVKHRNHPEDPVTVPLPKDPVSSLASNITILPGDTIIVSTAGIVYVVGDVAKPSGFILDNQKLTILQALALAGGANHTAALDQAKVIRQTSNGREEIAVPLKKIVADQSADVPLQANDILFVPFSKEKKAVFRGLEAAVSAATGIAIYQTRPCRGC